MNLSASDFNYNDQNVEANIVIEDGYLTVTKIDMSEVAITTADAIYNGENQTTVLGVTWGARTLEEGTDYEVVSDSSTQIAKNVGQYTITLKGLGNYDENTTKQCT